VGGQFRRQKTEDRNPNSEFRTAGFRAFVSRLLGGRRSLGAVKPDGDKVHLLRLQGTAALQVNSGYRSSDRDLEAAEELRICAKILLGSDRLENQPTDPAAAGRHAPAYDSMH
jgi:hypothetical protein